MKQKISILTFILLSISTIALGKCCNPNPNCSVRCPILPILSVPFEITQPGHYLMPVSLTYTGSGSAISVLTPDNVTIEFCDGTELTITDPAAVGVRIDGVSNVKVINPVITASLAVGSNTNRAIFASNASDVLIQGGNLTDFNQAIRLETSNGVVINDMHIVANNGENPIDNIIVARSTSGLVIKNSFAQTTSANNILVGGIFIATLIETSNISKSVTLQNLELNNVDVFIQEAQSILAENIASVINDSDYIFSMFQFGAGAALPDLPSNAHDAILRNSTFSNRNASDSAIGVQVTQGSGFIIDNIVVDINSAGTADPDECQTDPDFGASGAKLAIGNNGNSGCTSQVSDCVVRNSVFTSTTPSGYGITILGTPAIEPNPANPNLGIIIDNCLVTNCFVDGILVRNSLSCSIQNSNIQRCTENGIHLDDTAFSNAILNNVVSNNDGNGITIEDGAILNHLQDNKVFDNDSVGINNLEGTTEIYYNTSCNNGTNCIGVFPSNNPGDPSVVGENICCAPIPG